MNRTYAITPKIFAGHLPEVKDMQTGILYISKKFQTAIHLCCCGCGVETVTPLNPRGWAMTETPEHEVSLHPSILNRSCRAHYFIRDNEVIWI